MYQSTHRVVSSGPFHTLRAFCTDQSNKAPILICYSLIQSGAILDLTKDNSFITALTQLGFPVYILDWHSSQNSEKSQSLSQCIDQDLKHCVDFICQEQNTQSIHLIGICQGGNLSLLFSNRYHNKIDSLTLINTPINFQTSDDVIAMLMGKINLDENTWKNKNTIPGEWIAQFFLTLKPFQFFSKIISKKPSLFKQNFIQWMSQPPAVAALSLYEFIQTAYIKNEYSTGSVTIDNQKIKLNQFKNKILSIHSEDDHIVPIASSQALSELYSDKQLEQLVLPGGHLGVLLNAQSQQHICSHINRFIQ